MANPLWLLIVVPLGAGLVNGFLPAAGRKALTGLALAFGIFSTVRLFGTDGASWPFLGVTVLSLDRLSFMALAFIQGLSAIIFVFALKGLDKDEEKPFLALYPLTVGAAVGVVLSGHGIALLLFWGMSGLLLYGFALLGKAPGAPSAAKKTFIMVGGSDAFLLLGLAILGTRSGWSLASPAIPLSEPGAALAFICILAGALAKAGGFPLHTWVPDFCQPASEEASAFLPASLDKLLGIYLLARIMTSYFQIGPLIHMIVISLGALTVITAVMMALVQHDGRRLLGYHAVSQVGYMIMGVASGSAVAFAAGLFHMVNNTLYKSGLFLSLGAIRKRTGTTDLDELGGLARAMPLTFAAALIGALSISGIPPFNGFFSKWMLYQGLFEKAKGLAPGYQAWLLVCILLALFGSALTLASFVKFLHAAFLGRRPKSLATVREAEPNQWLSAGFLALLCLVFGLFAREIPLRLFILPAAAASGYAATEIAGLYDPRLVTALMAAVILVAWALFRILGRVREDDPYIGGHKAEESYRVTGADFYKEIAEMKPLRRIYALARAKLFDIYEGGAKGTFALSGWLQKAHSGLLPVYLLFIVAGLAALLILAT